MITKEQHAALCRPFPVEDIEWKLIQAWDRGARIIEVVAKIMQNAYIQQNRRTG